MKLDKEPRRQSASKSLAIALFAASLLSTAALLVPSAKAHIESPSYAWTIRASIYDPILGPAGDFVDLALRSARGSSEAGFDYSGIVFDGSANALMVTGAGETLEAAKKRAAESLSGLIAGYVKLPFRQSALDAEIAFRRLESPSLFSPRTLRAEDVKVTYGILEESGGPMKPAREYGALISIVAALASLAGLAAALSATFFRGLQSH